MSEKIDNGGPAFPIPVDNDVDCHGRYSNGYGGMSLRDWLAGKSIDAAFEMERRNPTHDCDGCASFRGVAERAYLLADAMIKARGGK